MIDKAQLIHSGYPWLKTFICRQVFFIHKPQHLINIFKIFIIHYSHFSLCSTQNINLSQDIGVHFSFNFQPCLLCSTWNIQSFPIADLNFLCNLPAIIPGYSTWNINLFWVQHRVSMEFTCHYLRCSTWNIQYFSGYRLGVSMEFTCHYLCCST